jgi:predicted PurR-regulated permease PerM
MEQGMSSAQGQAWFWGVGLVLGALFLWLLAGTLVPFLVGAAIAYFLDPVADRLERLGCGRITATVVISIAGLLVFALTLIFAVPALVKQAQALVEAVPDYIDQTEAVLTARFPDLFNEYSSLRRSLGSMEETLREGGLAALNTVLVSSLAVFDFIVIIAITPVVAFYLLLDWDTAVARVDGWLPRRHAPTVRRLAGEIDEVLAGFVRGQLSVCLILGTFYAVALMAIGLPYGFLVGLTAGLVAFIPYVGTFFGGALAIGIALFSFWGQPGWILATAGIFAFGQFVEGNILAPKLIGASVGLHPVWLIFALAVFGALFGFAGLLIAVPVAAALGVLGRFAVERYLASPMYTGEPPPGEPKA